ncbi:hypothetical protein F4553_007706 [Allocatelliglobosispora scoriae]|uniref:DUF732 domain-containing protein n=1 Tax=Allocatelliglobosispora scoriae TaxID=643052 RepID=A0A841C5C4_9ACTN|nr:hypothetical protein [Allocatelliglobosispora scoriae]
MLLVAAAFMLGACGDSADSGSPGAPSGPATTAAAVSAVDAAKLCDFLRSEIPRLSAVGSEVGRLAQLTGHLYTWGEEQKVVGKMDVEQLTKQSCPDVRAAVLKLLGEDSFSNVF